jgi:hypothetical protein
MDTDFIEYSSHENTKRDSSRAKDGHASKRMLLRGSSVVAITDQGPRSRVGFSSSFFRRQQSCIPTLEKRDWSLDIMTSNGGRLTPDVTRVSLPKPVPHHVET